MDILKLKINNFLAIGDAPELDLKDRGLVLIQGVNEDDSSATSNGVGKSSIADALCWVLYGETARGISGDAVVNKVAKKDCAVSVLVRDGATGYRITRYRKHKEFKNQLRVEAASGEGGLWVDLSKGTDRETQALVNEVMGCSLDVFMAAIYAGQEVTPDLPKMTDKQLKLLIEEAAGVERLERAYEIAREKLLAAKNTVNGAMVFVNDNKERLAAAHASVMKRKELVDDFEGGRAGRRDGYQENAAKDRESMLSLAEKIKSVGEKAVNERLAEIGTVMGEYKKSTDHLASLKRTLQDAEKTHDRAFIRLEAQAKFARGYKDLLENAAEEMKKPCPECGKPHTEDELEEYKSHLKGKLNEALVALKAVRFEEEAAKTVVQAAKQAVDEYAATLPDMSELMLEQTSLNAALRHAGDLRSKLALNKKEYDRQIELADRAMTEPNPNTSALEVLVEQVKTLEAKIAEGKAQLEGAENALQTAENVAKVFSPAGVRAHILDTVTPFLNDRTGDYLSALSDGNIGAVWTTLAKKKDGDLKEKFNIEVTNEKGAESFAGLSGGEKRKVRLATMLALQDLVASRATKPINIWLGDEIDDALDAAGLERLMAILERKARERGTVLIISHHDLKDWVDDVTTVTKRSGTSTIEGALCL